MERIGRKNLVVAYSKSSRLYLRVALEKEGDEIQACGDAVVACWDIIDKQPDFIISDCRCRASMGRSFANGATRSMA
jgi:CheY-like chemotaxis protein